MNRDNQRNLVLAVWLVTLGAAACGDSSTGGSGGSGTGGASTTGTGGSGTGGASTTGMGGAGGASTTGAGGSACISCMTWVGDTTQSPDDICAGQAKDAYDAFILCACMVHCSAECGMVSPCMPTGTAQACGDCMGAKCGTESTTCLAN